MAIAFRNLTSGNPGSGISGNIAVPAGTVSGDAVLGGLSGDGSGNTITFSGGSTWNHLTALSITNGDAQTFRTGYKSAGASEGANYTWANSSGNAVSVCVLSYSGVDPAVLDGAVGTATSSNNPNSATPPSSPISATASAASSATAGAWAVMFFTVDSNGGGAGAWTAPGSTNTRSNQAPAQFSNLLVVDAALGGTGSTGSFSATYTQAGNSGNPAAYMLVLKPASSGTAQQPNPPIDAASQAIAAFRQPSRLQQPQPSFPLGIAAPAYLIGPNEPQQFEPQSWPYAAAFAQADGVQQPAAVILDWSKPEMAPRPAQWPYPLAQPEAQAPAGITPVYLGPQSVTLPEPQSWPYAALMSFEASPPAAAAQSPAAVTPQLAVSQNWPYAVADIPQGAAQFGITATYLQGPMPQIVSRQAWPYASAMPEALMPIPSASTVPWSAPPMPTVPPAWPYAIRQPVIEGGLFFGIAQAYVQPPPVVMFEPAQWTGQQPQRAGVLPPAPAAVVPPLDVAQGGAASWPYAAQQRSAVVVGQAPATAPLPRAVVQFIAQGAWPYSQQAAATPDVVQQPAAPVPPARAPQVSTASWGLPQQPPPGSAVFPQSVVPAGTAVSALLGARSWSYLDPRRPVPSFGVAVSYIGPANVPQVTTTASWPYALAMLRVNTAFVLAFLLGDLRIWIARRARIESGERIRTALAPGRSRTWSLEMDEELEKSSRETATFTLDCTGLLGSDELITGNISLLDSEPSGLVFSAFVVNSAPMNYRFGRTAAAGKALQFKCSGGQTQADGRAQKYTGRALFDTSVPGNRIEATFTVVVDDKPKPKR